MARTKKITAAPPPPKASGTVKHGCCSCVYYKLDPRQMPCRDCEKWNYWEDSSPKNEQPFPTTATGQLSLISG